MPLRPHIVKELVTTTKYHILPKNNYDNDAAEADLSEEQRTEWSNASEIGDAEHPWSMWNGIAETHLQQITQDAAQRRQERTTPWTTQRNLWPPAGMTGAETKQQRRLRRLYAQLIRLKTLTQPGKHLDGNETSKLQARVQKTYSDLFEEKDTEMELTVATAIQRVMGLRENMMYESKLLRLQKWRERMPSKISKQ